MINEEMQPELKDIFEMLMRYSAANKNEVCFIGSVIAFKKNKNRKCVDCGEPTDEIDDLKSRLFAYGDRDTLRMMLNDLRDTIEDGVDDDGFVNL